MQKIDYKVTHDCEKTHCYVGFNESDKVSEISVQHNHPNLFHISTKQLDKKELEQILDKLQTCMHTLENSQITMMGNDCNTVVTALKAQRSHDMTAAKIIATKLINLC